MDVVSVIEDVVTFEWQNGFPDGSTLRGVSSLRFRSEEAVRASVARAGFEIEAIFGGWSLEPTGLGVGELVVVAQA